jgi:hypothetical protein
MGRAMPSLPSLFRRLLKQSASAQIQDGWRVRGAGLEFHASDGCWGQIVFSGASREEAVSKPWDVRGEDEFIRERPVLRMSLTAGTCAPYLMRAVNKLDPVKPPTRSFVAAHVIVCWDVSVVFARSVRRTPEPFEIPVGYAADCYYIDPESGARWLRESLAALASQTQALASEEAIYKELSAKSDAFGLRYAYLLARHLGYESDLPVLAERARQASEEERRRSTRQDWTYADRQATYPQDWSHERFLRFVESTPP